MKLPPSNHAVWKIARLSIVCATMLIFFATIYTQPIEGKDIATIIGTLLALSGFDITKSIATSKQE